MSNEKKSSEATPRKPAAENKVVEAKSDASPKSGLSPKSDASAGSDTSVKPDVKPDAAARKQGMGEGQKPVSKAYKDNWNDIFGKKKKR